MNLKTLKTGVLVLCLGLSLSGCSLFSGDSSDDTDAQRIGIDGILVSFDAAPGKELYHSLPFTNTSDAPFVLNQIEFEDNKCGAFSLFSITNASGESLSALRTPLDIPVLPGQRVNLNIRFRPDACPYSNYDAVLSAYYTDGSSILKRFQVRLRSVGKAADQGGDNAVCDTGEEEYEYIEEFISVIPPEGDYFLRVLSMRGFIYPEIEPGKATLIGTDIGELNPGDFTAPHLPIHISSDGTLSLPVITPCEEFIIPSALTDIYFTGADTLLTSLEAVEGKFVRDTGRKVHLTLDGLTVRLRGEGISGSSLIASETGLFQITVKTDLTTRKTEPSEFLKVSLENQDLFKADQDLFKRDCNYPNLKCALEGNRLVDGAMTLVGTGTFLNEDNSFIGASVANTFLIANPASIYVQLELQLTRREVITP